jgi:hypothetical protein
MRRKEAEDVEVCRELNRMREGIQMECLQEKERMSALVDNFQSTYQRIIQPR